MHTPLSKNRHGFVLVEFMILAAAFCLLALVALTHLKHPSARRSSIRVAETPGLQYALGVYVSDR